MTRRLLICILFCAAALLGATVATAPVGVDGATLVPVIAPHAAPGPGAFDVRLGDGLVRVRIRGCGTCRTLVRIEIRLPRLLERRSAA